MVLGCIVHATKLVSKITFHSTSTSNALFVDTNINNNTSCCIISGIWCVYWQRRVHNNNIQKPNPINHPLYYCWVSIMIKCRINICCLVVFSCFVLCQFLDGSDCVWLSVVLHDIHVYFGACTSMFYYRQQRYNIT